MKNVMIALGDINKLNRFLFRGGVRSQQQDLTGVPTSATREGVREVLAELLYTVRDMINMTDFHMFSHFHEGHRIMV